MNVSTTIQKKIRKVSTANAANPISSLNSEIGKFTNLRSALRNGAVGYRLTARKLAAAQPAAELTAGDVQESSTG